MSSILARSPAGTGISSIGLFGQFVFVTLRRGKVSNTLVPADQTTNDSLVKLATAFLIQSVRR